MAVDKFEHSLKKLEGAVNLLESGELSLEESLKVFEEGIKHSAICSQKLTEAQQRVEVLLRLKDGSLKREDFAAVNAGQES